MCFPKVAEKRFCLKLRASYLFGLQEEEDMTNPILQRKWAQKLENKLLRILSQVIE